MSFREYLNEAQLKPKYTRNDGDSEKEEYFSLTATFPGGGEWFLSAFKDNGKPDMNDIQIEEVSEEVEDEDVYDAQEEFMNNFVKKNFMKLYKKAKINY